MTEKPANPTAAPGAIKAVEEALRRFGARARLALLTQRSARLLAVAIAIVVVLTVADYFLRLPAGLRWVHLIVGLGVIGWAIWKFIAPAWRLRPTLATLALRVEKTHPELAGVLASGVEFDLDASISHRASNVERTLAQRVAEEAASRFELDDLKGILRVNHVAQAIVALTFSLIAAALIVVMSPQLAGIGVTRTLAPWTDAQWPKRTAVADATDIEVHPLGAAIPLRAALTRSVRTPERTDVSVEYRNIRAGSTGAIRRELMTWQQRDISAGPTDGGALFERLIETDAESIEYRFVTFDDRISWKRVRLVAPPAVETASAIITPPAYAAALRTEGLAAPLTERTTVNLGDGTDERAIAPPALAGSRIELSLTLNKALNADPTNLNWLDNVIGDEILNADFSFESAAADSNEWTLSWTLADSVRLPISLVDEYGIESTAESVFRFESVQDRPATATVTEPAQDMSVLATAVVRVVGEGRDDVGLDAVWLERQRVRPAGGQPSGPGGAIEPVEEPVEVIRSAADGERVLEVETELDLAPLGLRPGDQLWLFAVADDVFAINGAAHESTRSITRVLRIIDESEFITEIRAELSALRQGAIRLFDDQQSLRDLDQDQRAATEALRRQAQLTERIARLGEQLSRVQQRVEDNALNDRQLDNVLDDARRFLQESGNWSGRATDRMEEAKSDRDDAEAEAEDEPLDQEEERQIDDAQQRVQDELAGLAELLDTGEDAWVARRQLEELLNEQIELQESTAAAARETAGREASELTPEERTELDRIVDKQLELAQDAEELAQDLEERARELEEHDPAAAAGMRQAARRARQSQVSQTMQQAAQQAEQNQMAQAGEQQQEAVEELEQMLEDLDEAERSREEVLRRVLASLIESLEALIEQQKSELARLTEARPDGPFDGLDEGMIRLNQNTLGVLDQASGAGRELAPVAQLIGRAVDAQTESIIALRAKPVDDVRADDQERRSLELLQQARDDAERLDQQMQQRQQERAREELRQAYREALERQVAVRAETADFAALEALDRRQRAAVRRLTQQQRAIRESLDELLTKSQELSEAAIFDYAHQRLNEEIDDAASRLDEDDVSGALPPEDTAVAILQGLVEALKEPPQNQDDFAQAGGGGGGGGGSPSEEPLIPPIAELRLLRQIQIDVARRTRLVDDSGGNAALVERLGKEQQQLGELGTDLIRRMQEQGQGPPPVQQEPPQ